MPRVSAGDLAWVRHADGEFNDPCLVGRVVRVQAAAGVGDTVVVDGTPLVVAAPPDGLVWWVTAPDGGPLDVTAVHSLFGWQRVVSTTRAFVADVALTRIAGPGPELPADPVAAPLPQPVEAL